MCVEIQCVCSKTTHQPWSPYAIHLHWAWAQPPTQYRGLWKSFAYGKWGSWLPLCLRSSLLRNKSPRGPRGLSSQVRAQGCCLNHFVCVKTLIQLENTQNHFVLVHWPLQVLQNSLLFSSLLFETLCIFFSLIKHSQTQVIASQCPINFSIMWS